MAKAFATTYSNGHRDEFTKAQCFQAKQVRNHDDAQTWELNGQPATVQEWFAEVRSCCESKIEAKEKTHKQVRVLYGTSATCYVWKWVPR